MYKIIPLDQGTPEWHEFRKDKIGGSDIPTIMGVNKYKKLEDLIQEKITGVSEEPSDFAKKIFQDGHDWEIVVRDQLNATDGYSFKPVVLQSENNDRFFVSLDGIDFEKKLILEVKSTVAEDILSRVKNGVCPPSYYAQIQWQFFITGYATGVLAVVNRNTGGVYKLKVARDEEMIKDIQVKAKEFLEQISQGVQPYIKLEVDTVKSIANKKHIIDEAKKRMKEIDSQIKEIEKEIKAEGKALLASYKAKKIEGCGVRIQWIKPKGVILWKTIPEVMSLTEEYLDKFRSSPSGHIKISGINEKETDE